METKTYEGMFLLEPTQAAQEWESLRKQVISMIERRGGVILSAKKWAERKLAYEIQGHKRGTYFLVYFKMPPLNIATFRRDMQLSELVLRNLILVHDQRFQVPELVEGPEQEQEKAKEELQAKVANPEPEPNESEASEETAQD